MRRAAREVSFAVLAWLVPFVVSVCLFPLKASHEPLFDTLMGVTLTFSTVALGVAYFSRLSANYVAQGARIGITWAAANWFLDGLMFSSGPMKMSLNQYVMDIGIAYLAIPVMTVGLGAAARMAAKERSSISNMSPSQQGL
jgi:uncharacterized membrane protein YpjA